MKRFKAAITATLILLATLVWLLYRFMSPSTGGVSSRPILMYCAAGLRLPVEKIVSEYQRELGIQVEVYYGGTNTLLNQLEVAQTGDLFLSADESALEMAYDRALVAESIPVAVQHPVIVVSPGNPRQIRSTADLLRSDVRSAMGNPDQAANGTVVRNALQKLGTWEPLFQHITRTGVFHPTVPEVANDVKLGSVDAGIVWNSTASMMTGLEVVSTPELSAMKSHVTIAVLASCQHSAEALRFARYLAARDRGLPAFAQSGFSVVTGDQWQSHPTLTFFCGTVNRRAVESVVRDFSAREGVTVNTVYNGCGILTAQMQATRQNQTPIGFPDTYMACDRYYLETVRDWFQEGSDVSDTSIVIAVAKGNPHGIQSIKDLAQPGLRITLGQPDQCTIGVLTRNVLRAANLETEILRNVVQETTSSALLIPSVVTNAADATFAYATDTTSEQHQIDTIELSLPEAKAIQPFAIAKSSEQKNLARRFFRKLMDSRESFEAAGFHFHDSNSPTRGVNTGSPDPAAGNEDL
ncbi:MAG: molybdate ABC transporter substrate-binding protein [Planctomycetota bacterium]|nr:molybdate ABC transporter substrate-binding protein [Planctomycetota bacterium]